MIKGVLLDLAGVVYEGDHAIAGAAEAVACLRGAGLAVRFISNTTRQPLYAILGKLHRLGLDVSDADLLTPAVAARGWLAANACSPRLLVHPDLAEEFDGLPGDRAPAVIVGDAGTAFTYDALNRAFREIEAGAAFLALAPNRVFRDADGKLSLDAGPFVKALEFAAGRQAIVLGKPSPDFFALALDDMDCAPGDAVMVGDDAENDVAGALTAGLGKAVLVRTGKFRPGDETRFEPRPSHVAGDLAAAADWILARGGAAAS